ncbi:centrosomal protein of 55 kDa-like isoform X1 [Parambassis ranga]|uniref:Centrosomal protein of 55 kDa-like isoform X1 n=1 Tax=Parambassis ranga TaxID=210632 RepID=A0A6P7JQM4_9TELE|nr:centrosomal protein of 55 kDa-like isoform X1 [Parambassis ranga]XP_028279257.1 centrosomal protein of 55 kDa-like isoform X1 [Parambassis ranga]
MAASKYKRSMKTNVNSKLVMALNSLRKENTYLKKTLTELSQQHAEHSKQVERCLTLVSRRLDSLEEPGKKEVNPCYGMNMRMKPGGGAPALEENKQWLEYDQQREACVRGMMSRMLWLENQLNKANQARSQQHNEDYSDEDGASCPQANCRRRMQINYDTIDNLMDELINIRDHVKAIYDRLFSLEDSGENEHKELPQTEREDHHQSEDEEQQLSEDTKDLQSRLDKERRRSYTFELQANVLQRFILNRHHADQEKIENLKRQIKIMSQDLQDEKKDCSYLRKQVLKLLKMRCETKDSVASQSKEDVQDSDEYEERHSPPQHSRDRLRSSSNSSSCHNESILHCPNCHAVYPSNLYRELMNHLETCMD